MKIIFFTTLALSLLSATVEISGDARVRPRLDNVNDGQIGEASRTESTNLYYMYRARVNLKSKIGKGYFFNAKIGTNETASINKMGVEQNSTYKPKSGNINASRPQIHFLEIYYGIKKDNFGIWAGALPIKHNPGLDLHFYANKIVDIPFSLNNNNSIVGFSGYQKIMKYNFKWFLSVDSDVANSSKTEEGEIKQKDIYTFCLDASINMGPLKMHPQILYTITDTNASAPITFGANFTLPKLLGITSSISYYTSNNSNQLEYDTDHIRTKLESNILNGKLSLFYDIASYKEKNEAKMNLDYLWLSYGYNLYSSDIGSVTLKPTIRIQNGSITNKDYSRTKMELTTEIKFK